MNIVAALPVLLALAAGRPNAGQDPSLGTVVVVNDTSGSPLPGVTVALLPQGQQRGAQPLKLTTGASGQARFLNTPHGNYEIVCSLNSFLTTRLGPTRLSPEARLRFLVILNFAPSWGDEFFTAPLPTAVPSK